jgi:hypothetical protein
MGICEEEVFDKEGIWKLNVAAFATPSLLYPMLCKI